jgi:epoxyqueuosine reductase
VAISAVGIRREALALGFLACGITELGPTPHADELDRWLARGFAGNMRYLHRQAKKRKDSRQIVAGARTAVVVLDNYYTHPSPTSPTSLRSWPSIAKYARGRDYHLATMERLERLAGHLRSLGATVARPFVDGGPVPERELAQRAGLGWIGKNTMLIRPGTGSLFFIGAVLTDLGVTPDAPFESDHCGSCTRCLDACPTGALVEDRVLDATRCISYLTIEHKGPMPEPLAGKLGGWAFGCDICNDVCPWNERFAARQASAPDFAPRRDLDDAGSDFFERLTAEEFDRRFADTPLERPGLGGMRRNWKAAWASLPKEIRT